jgi:predicted DNA-binding transcriptional regulator AlpA
MLALGPSVSYLRHMPSPQKLISTSEVAALLGIDPRTVQRRAESGDIPTAGKLPGATGAYLFNEADVLREAHLEPSERAS